MTNKEWILLAGVLLFIWWRNSGVAATATDSAVSTTGSAGYANGGSPPAENVVIPPSAGNGNVRLNPPSVTGGGRFTMPIAYPIYEAL